MRVSIEPRSLTLDDAFRAYLAQRLGFAFGRFGERVARVAIRVADANGKPRTGATRCSVDVRLRPAGRVVVEHRDDDPRVAVDRALARAARAVGRALEEPTAGAPGPSWAAGGLALGPRLR